MNIYPVLFLFPVSLLACCVVRETSTAASETGSSGGRKQDPRFTGDPQLDWQWDPNYPRELRGYNMSGYPFFSRVPGKIKYSCKDRIDGFYANIDYKCQVRGMPTA